MKTIKLTLLQKKALAGIGNKWASSFMSGFKYRTLNSLFEHGLLKRKIIKNWEYAPRHTVKFKLKKRNFLISFICFLWDMVIWSEQPNRQNRKKVNNKLKMDLEPPIDDSKYATQVDIDYTGQGNEPEPKLKRTKDDGFTVE